MLKKAKSILRNEQGMETIEVLGMGVVALIAGALFYNATKAGFNSTTNKAGNGLNSIGGLTTNTATLTP